MRRCFLSAAADAIRAILGVSVLAIGAVSVAPASAQEAIPIVGIAGVVDGDTLDVASDAGARRIPIEGIDAPEAGQICQDARGMEWRCGRAATRS